jgi:hypothetical protein
VLGQHQRAFSFAVQIDRVGFAHGNPIVRRLERLNDLRFGVDATDSFNEVPPGGRRIASFCQEDSQWRKTLRRTQRVVLVLYRKSIGWKQITENGTILKRTSEKIDFDRIIAAFPEACTFLFVPLWLKRNGQIGASRGVVRGWNRLDTTLHLDWGTRLWA